MQRVLAQEPVFLVDRGVFITTSRFSAEAGSYVERILNRIVLIDGQRLAELMILHRASTSGAPVGSATI